MPPVDLTMFRTAEELRGFAAALEQRADAVPFLWLDLALRRYAYEAYEKARRLS